MCSAQVIPPVVVGVDGSDHGLRALDWAALAVGPRGWPLRLVNAYDLGAYVVGLPELVGAEELEAANSAAVLDAARQHLVLHHPEVKDVTSVSHRGGEVSRC